jgi:hypothetical protein
MEGSDLFNPHDILKGRKCVNSGKKYGKTKYEFTTWQIKSSIVDEFFRYKMSCIGGTLLQNFIGNKKVEKSLYLEEKKLEKLKKNSRKMDVSSRNINPYNKLKINSKELYKRLESIYIILYKKIMNPNWDDEDECIIIFGDFISLFSSNNKLWELNITSSVISKMFNPNPAKLPAIISLKKRALMNYPILTNLETRYFIVLSKDINSNIE